MIRPPTRRSHAALALAVVPIVGAGAGGPADASTPAGGDGWQVAAIAPIDVGGSPLSLSPDGAWLAGIGPDDDVCVWDVLGDLAATCAPAGESGNVDPSSFAWAPDSSAVAFSMPAFEFLIDSDIHVFDIAAVEVVNITDDGADGRLDIDAEGQKPVPLDVMPTWTPDGAAVVFSRSLWNRDEDVESTDIMSVPRAGGEATVLGTVERPFAVYTPMRVLSDGAVLYAVGAQDPADEANGVWRLDPDGTTTQLIVGNDKSEFPQPVITDVAETDDGYEITGYSSVLASAYTIDAEHGIAFQWSSETGELTALAPVTTEQHAWVWSAAFAPDSGSILQLTSVPGGPPAVELVGPAETSTQLPEVDEAGEAGLQRHPVPTWADNGTALVPAVGRSGPVLVTLSPAG